MILIADGGSTKTHWALITKDLCVKEFYSEGYNPYFVDKEYIVESLSATLPPDLIPQRVSEIHFYGAGVNNEQKSEVLKAALSKVFPEASISVYNDLLAACRALLQNNSGFASILGTGTNSCYYDGENITYQIDSGAYILGDEGSGCHIGKKLLKHYLRRQLPQDLQLAFDQKYGLSAAEILERIYARPLANRFCASFTPFIQEHIGTEYAQALVRESFSQLFENLISRYPDYQEQTFNSVGSIGYYFQEILSECAESFGMRTGNMIKSPMPGLLLFHKSLLLKKSGLTAGSSAQANTIIS